MSMSTVIDPLGIFGIEDKKDVPTESEATPAAPEAKVVPAEPVATVGPTNPDVEARADDFKTREENINQRASAAGATRSGNDADVLGYSLPRKRSAGRAILG